MAKVNTEFFIARRISSGESPDRRNVMVLIAAFTVVISMTVMIVSLAVISGFKKELTGKLAGFGGHVQVVGLDANSSFETKPITRNLLLEEGFRDIRGLRSLNTFAVKGGIIMTGEATQGIMLKGVDEEFDWSFFRGNLVAGTLPVVADSVAGKDILISQRISSLMKLGTDDFAEMLFVTAGAPPRRDMFRVAGIYNTGFEELDNLVVVTDIRNVQRLNGWESGQITGYELNTTDFRNLVPFAGNIYDVVAETPLPPGENLMVVDIKERFPALFDWLGAHNVNAAVIITIMVLVALLNMTSALLIILLERTRMIGVLKTLGMTNRSLQKMFLIRSSFIIARGLLWGNAVGLSLCLIQKWTHAVKLDELGYFLSEVPVNIEFWWLLALNAGTFFVILAILALPVTVVSRISPEKTIRYQ